MQVEWYEPSPRDKRRADAFYATPEGKKALERLEKLLNSVPNNNNSSTATSVKRNMCATTHPMK